MAYHPKPKSCEGCAAATVGRSFVPSRGPKGAPVLLLDQWSDETSASLGSPFVGENGKRVGTWLRLAGIDPLNCRYDSIARCAMPENHEPTRAEVDHCRDAHWGVETAGRRIIIPIGVPAMRQFYPKAGESTAGQIIKHELGRSTNAADPGRFQGWAADLAGSTADIIEVKEPLAPAPTYVVGLLHPAFILRGNWALEPLQIQTLKLVRRILDGESPEIHDFSQPHPAANLYPTLGELRAWRADFRPGDEVAVDVEAAGNVLTMVGMCRVRDLAHVTVWFRQQGGDPWPHPDWPALVEWLYDFLADGSVGKVFHNAAYDLDQLEDVGFEVNGFSYDTLLGMHLSFPEMRKRLESVTLLCAGFTGWKALLRDGEGHNK